MSADNIKILHVINSLAAAGAENLVVSFANEQVSTAKVSLFTFYSEKDVFHKRLSKEVKFWPHSNKNYLAIRKLRNLLRLIKTHDIIHVHLFPPFYIVAFLSFFVRGKTFVYTEHNTYNFRRKWIFKLLERIVYSRYQQIICISDGAEFALKKWMGNTIRSTVIRNAINLKEIAKAIPFSKHDLGISEESVPICMIGRFQEQKDQDTLIKALNLLPKKYTLLLIGEGEREGKLKELVASLKLTDRVIFLGIRSDVYGILKGCDYGVLSSHWEGFGMVALEYMASGIIAIGSNLDGLSEVIKYEKCLFNPTDSKGLADILEYFEANPEEKEKARQIQAEHLQGFDIPYAVEQHFKAYKLA